MAKKNKLAKKSVTLVPDAIDKIDVTTKKPTLKEQRRTDALDVFFAIWKLVREDKE